jgi:hypothetical protein
LFHVVLIIYLSLSLELFLLVPFWIAGSQ